jgi:hypothetical protein
VGTDCAAAINRSGEGEELRTLGYEAQRCLVDLGETAEQTLESALRWETMNASLAPGFELHRNGYFII